MDVPSLTERLSWRDPDGFVLDHGGRILRAVASERSEQVRALLGSAWMRDLVAEGVIPHTFEFSETPSPLEFNQKWIWLEHQRLPFPVYPHEITALQLYDSGRLTLRLAIEAAKHGWVLKDASSWNVLHSQGRPVFVDVLSFDRHDSPGTWVAYGQFVRHFILPLLIHRKLGILPHEQFIANRDGISPDAAYQLLRGIRLLSSTALETVVLPRLLSSAGSRLIATHSVHQPKTFGVAAGANILLSTLRRLQRRLDHLQPELARVSSLWKGYEEDRDHYSEADLASKRDFVQRHLIRTERVLDLGCNAGEFSLLAAGLGNTVTAADSDHPALSRLYARIRGQKSQITPVLLNIGRPTPSVGWENKEVKSFIERSINQFDCVLLLGLIHHLLVSERITLPMLADLLDRLNPTRLILEWIDPKDRKFRQLAGLNGALYRELDASCLEESLGRKFRSLEKMPLPCSTRIMYLWSR